MLCALQEVFSSIFQARSMGARCLTCDIHSRTLMHTGIGAD
jgi:hypothetical protein